MIQRCYERASRTKRYVSRALAARTLGPSELVLSVGMPRSGSTLLFNVVRLCLGQKHGNDLVAGWIDDIPDFRKRATYLVKSHEIHPFMGRRASQIFYSFRDIRDVLVSRERKFGFGPTVDACRKYIADFQAAERYAAHMFRYEDFTVDLEGTVRRVAAALDVQVDAVLVARSVPQAWVDLRRNVDYDRTTLLYGGHSSGSTAGAWRTGLAPELKDQIHRAYGWWFEANDYDLA